MQDYISLIVSFVIGGGLTSMMNLRLNRKGAKLDLTEKLVEFWKEQAGDLLDRVDKLEDQVKELLKSKCIRKDCDKRI